MKLRIYTWFMVLTFLATTTGCTNAKELNRVSFITAIGIDKSKSNVIVHALIAVPGKFSSLTPGGGGGSENQSPNYILTTEGTNVAEALNKMKRKTAGDMNFRHTKLILFSDELAKEGISPFLDLFMRREEFLINSWLGITKGSTKRILQVKPEAPQSVTDYWVDVFSKAGTDSMEIYPIYLFRFYSYLHEPGQTPYAMEISTQEEGNQLQLTDLGLFHDGKMVGTLTPKETKYLQMISGNRLKTASFTIEKRNYSVLAFHTKKKITEEGINLDMSFKLELDENPSGPLPYPKMLDLEPVIANTLQNDIEGLIKKLQNLQTDPAGFGEKYRITHGGDLQADEWLERIYPELPVHVKVKVRIESKGMIT